MKLSKLKPLFYLAISSLIMILLTYLSVSHNWLGSIVIFGWASLVIGFTTIIYGAVTVIKIILKYE